MFTMKNILERIKKLVDNKNGEAFDGIFYGLIVWLVVGIVMLGLMLYQNIQVDSAQPQIIEEAKKNIDENSR